MSLDITVYMHEDDITIEDSVKITEKLKDYFDSITR